jgi:hypothetical protein
VELKHVLGEIKTDRGNLHLDGSPHVIRLQRSPYGTGVDEALTPALDLARIEFLSVTATRP